MSCFLRIASCANSAATWASSSLASAGIGLIEYNLTRFQGNVLDTPREGPRFTPAVPVRRFVPVISNQVIHSLPGIGQADVRVRVDDWGHAGDIELLSGHDEFGNLAARAAALWRFRPARLDGRPVDCEMILHFRLQPPHERDENDLAVRK